MTYHRGTLAEFDTWHEAAKTSEGIPSEGKIGFIKGVPMPDNQRTTAYSKAKAHPINADDYVWRYSDYPDGGKDNLSKEDVQTAGWFAISLPEDEV